MGRKPKQTSSGKRGKATPVSKRRLSGKTTPKAAQKSKGAPRAAATSKGRKRVSSKSSAPKERRKSAYSLYSAECRGDVLRGRGIEDVPQNFGEASKALAKSWSELDAETKQKFEVRSKLDQHRCTLQSFAGQSNLFGHVEKVASEVRHAIKDFGKLPRAERTGELVDGVITALETLNAKLTPDLQAAMGASVGDRLPSPEAAQNFRKALGTALGDRLVTLLQRWHRAAVGKPTNTTVTPTPARSGRHQAASSSSTATPTPARSGRHQAASSSSTAPVEEAGEAVTVDKQTRNKVVGIMMKTSARGAGKASFQVCRNIEEELFKLHGSTPKEYFRRARSLRFNLGATDGALLQRVLEGELSPAELVRMSAEDLAPEAVREERERERERYFKTEVHLTERLRKRRRQTFETSYGRAAERLSDGAQMEATQVDSQLLERQGSFGAATEAGPSTDEMAAEAQAEQPELSRKFRRSSRRRSNQSRSGTLVNVSDPENSGSDSGSDSSSSGSSSSSELDIEGELAHLLEQDPVPLQGPSAADSGDLAVSMVSDLEIARALQQEPSASSSSSSSDSSSEEEADVGPDMQMAMAEGRAQLWTMGFSAEDADAALLAAKGNLERAVAMLVKKRT